jgi:hypothetical protein
MSYVLKISLYNPIMPDAVRLAHFKEIFSSNFIFGWFVVWVLNMGQNKG